MTDQLIRLSRAKHTQQQQQLMRDANQKPLADKREDGLRTVASERELNSIRWASLGVTLVQEVRKQWL